MDKVAVVTGGSSGLGLEVAKRLCSLGCTVYTISRRPFSHEGIFHIQADVSSECEVLRAFELVASEVSGIDILVNCAGFGISGAVEFTSLEAAKKQFDVNFFGMVNSNRAVLPYMRNQGHGTIINISSMASPVGIPFQTFYSASKGAIDSYTLALRNEVRSFGIHVSAVLPGDIATGFTDARQKQQDGDEQYNMAISRSVGKMEKDERTGMSAQVAGKRIASIALKNNPKPMYTIDFVSSLERLLMRILPQRFSNWLVYRLYG